MRHVLVEDTGLIRTTFLAQSKKKKKKNFFYAAWAVYLPTALHDIDSHNTCDVPEFLTFS